MQTCVSVLMSTTVGICALPQQVPEKRFYSVPSFSLDVYFVTPACPFQLECIKGVIPVPSNSSTETPSTSKKFCNLSMSPSSTLLKIGWSCTTSFPLAGSGGLLASETSTMVGFYIWKAIVVGRRWSKWLACPGRRCGGMFSANRVTLLSEIHNPRADYSLFNIGFNVRHCESMEMY